MVKVQYYFLIDEVWQTTAPSGQLPQLPSIGELVDYGNKLYKVVDINQEHDIYNLYLEEQES